MPNKRTDSKGFSTNNADIERDRTATGGPSTGLGTAPGKYGTHAPYDTDLQTQITAKGGKNKKSKSRKK